MRVRDHGNQHHGDATGRRKRKTPAVTESPWPRAVKSRGPFKWGLGPVDGRVGLDRVVELAHRHLGLDVAYVAELTGGRQVYRAIAGDSASFNISLDEGPPLEATYCRRLVAGEIPNVIQDTSENPSVAPKTINATPG